MPCSTDSERYSQFVGGVLRCSTFRHGGRSHLHCLDRGGKTSHGIGSGCLRGRSHPLFHHAQQFLAGLPTTLLSTRSQECAAAGAHDLTAIPLKASLERSQRSDDSLPPVSERLESCMQFLDRARKRVQHINPRKTDTFRSRVGRGQEPPRRLRADASGPTHDKPIRSGYWPCFQGNQRPLC